MNTEPLTKEEIKAVLREAFKARPRRNQQPPTKAQVAEERFAVAKRPTEAMAQDVTLTSTALAERLRDERGTVFSNQEIARRQIALDNATLATRRVYREIAQSPYHRGSASVGPRDSDAHLHVSPEDQLWDRVLWDGRK